MVDTFFFAIQRSRFVWRHSTSFGRLSILILICLNYNSSVLHKTIWRSMAVNPKNERRTGASWRSREPLEQDRAQCLRLAFVGCAVSGAAGFWKVLQNTVKVHYLRWDERNIYPCSKGAPSDSWNHVMLSEIFGKYEHLFLTSVLICWDCSVSILFNCQENDML